MQSISGSFKALLVHTKIIKIIPAYLEISAIILSASGSVTKLKTELSESSKMLIKATKANT